MACSSTPEAANPGSGSGSSSQDGSSSNAAPETEAPQTGASIDFANLKGDITIDGSSTVYPVSEAVAEEFGLLTGGNVRVTVGLSGSGGGFKKFCNGESDISSASRPIKQKEVDACLDAGIEYVEVPVAIDGLSVMTHPENTFINCMTIAELHTLWGPDAEGVITKWSQVRTGWPDEDIRLYGPGVDSGTFDYFTEVVNDEAASSRGDYTASEDDNVLVQGIGGGRNSLGFFGYAYYVENTDKLKLVGIDGGSGCVTPSNETIEDGSYQPLAPPDVHLHPGGGFGQAPPRRLRQVPPQRGRRAGFGPRRWLPALSEQRVRTGTGEAGPQADRHPVRRRQCAEGYRGNGPVRKPVIQSNWSGKSRWARNEIPSTLTQGPPHVKHVTL